MAAVAWDFFAGSGVAAADLDTRVADSGQPWTRANGAGITGPLSVAYSDSLADGKPKRIISSGAGGAVQVCYLPRALSLPLARAQARRAVLFSGAFVRGFIGIGFCLANGSGYFGGWDNNATPAAQGRIWRLDGPSGVATKLGGNWLSTLPYTAPFASLVQLEFERATGTLRMYWEDVLRVTVVDATFLPIYPAVAALSLGGTHTIDALLEAVFEEV